jgi:pectinesterase
MQTCHLHAIPERTGVITAQRRTSPSEESGYAFVNCTVTGSGLLYLGRPWGPFSRVVFAHTYFDDIIFPERWNNWDDSSRNK